MVAAVVKASERMIANGLAPQDFAQLESWRMASETRSPAAVARWMRSSRDSGSVTGAAGPVADPRGDSCGGSWRVALQVEHPNRFALRRQGYTDMSRGRRTSDMSAAQG